MIFKFMPSSKIGFLEGWTERVDRRWPANFSGFLFCAVALFKTATLGNERT